MQTIINPNDRRERAIDFLWCAMFIIVGFSVIAICLLFAPKGHDPVLASPLPACPNNTVTIGHNRPVNCDLASHGILIELGTSRTECANQGGRFLVISDRRLCVGEDI